jgi:hypothetical protein
VYKLINSLQNHPNKGDILGHVGNISIRELKYETFRFYFLINGNELSIYNKDKLQELLIRFVRMSKKNDQQKTIDEIKYILKRLGIEKINSM